MAEGVGFEPTRACALPVFKTGAINRSTTPPQRGQGYSATCCCGGKLRMALAEAELFSHRIFS